MNTIQLWEEKISRATAARVLQERPAHIFCKALYGYLILKILASWPVWSIFIKYHPPRIHPTPLSSLIFLPASWAVAHLDLFCWIALSFTIINLFTRVNYFSSVVIFWIGLNCYKIHFPAANGSDFVFILLLGLSVFMGSYSVGRRRRTTPVQQVIFITAVFLCQLQIMLMYLNSGFDKLMSTAWRSGEAFQYISRLDYLFHPSWLISGFTNPAVNLVLAWCVILFELSFPLLILNNRTRLYAIAAGIVFHIFIWVFLSLPDFGLIMIVSYLIFLNNRDYTRIVNFFETRFISVSLHP